MPYDPKSIINLGLGKITASRVSSLAPPKTPIEVKCAEGYDHWRDDELAKRDWRFALVEGHAPTLVTTLTDVSLPYKYALPNNYLRALPGTRTRWSIRGTFLYSDSNVELFDYIKRTTEADFSPAFAELLACRVAMEMAEHVTQSNSKGETADRKYERALAEAARQNAFITGPQEVLTADENDEWLTSRWGG